LVQEEINQLQGERMGITENFGGLSSFFEIRFLNMLTLPERHARA
jgi:hypothetical protein